MKAINRKDAVELLLVNRNFLYQLLYKAFAREPDAEFLDLLTSEQTGESFALLGGERLKAVPAFLQRLRDKTRTSDAVESLRGEYTRFFIGPMEMQAPPWESVYVGEQGMLFQESTLKVRDCYRHFGLLPEAYPRVADDSLALELGFMAELARRSAEAFEEQDTEALQKTLRGAAGFLDEHLLIWVPQLLERISDAEDAVLYPQLVGILDSFLKKDRETLNDLLTEGANAHD